MSDTDTNNTTAAEVTLNEVERVNAALSRLVDQAVNTAGRAGLDRVLEDAANVRAALVAAPEPTESADIDSLSVALARVREDHQMHKAFTPDMEHVTARYCSCGADLPRMYWKDDYEHHVAAAQAEVVIALIAAERAAHEALREAVEGLLGEADGSGKHVRGAAYVLARDLRTALAATAPTPPQDGTATEGGR